MSKDASFFHAENVKADPVQEHERAIRSDAFDTVILKGHEDNTYEEDISHVIAQPAFAFDQELKPVFQVDAQRDLRAFLQANNRSHLRDLNIDMTALLSALSPNVNAIENDQIWVHSRLLQEISSAINEEKNSIQNEADETN